jgi:hypothetical protein
MTTENTEDPNAIYKVDLQDTEYLKLDTRRSNTTGTITFTIVCGGEYAKDIVSLVQQPYPSNGNILLSDVQEVGLSDLDPLALTRFVLPHITSSEPLCPI